MKKRILSLLLAMLMALTVLPVFAETDDIWPKHVYAQINGWMVKFLTGEGMDENVGEGIEIVRCNNPNVGTHVVLPSEIEGEPVISIAGSMGLTGLTFASLGYYYRGMFRDEYNVVEVTIPDSVKYMYGDSFYKCETLKRVNFSKKLEGIGQSDFEGCISLEEVRLPDKVRYIDEVAFVNCTSLKSITLPASMRSIYRKAFEGCSSLETVYYAGTREQWSWVGIIAEGNEALKSATVYYNHPAHSMQYVTTEATCTESGAAAHYHCTLCGKDFLDKEGEIEFTGQTEGPRGHFGTRMELSPAPTCTEPGRGIMYCRRCDQAVGELSLSALGHEPGDWTVTTPASCTEAGVESLLCARCGEYAYDTRPIAALGHDYQPVQTTAPTCTENGYTTFVCSRCGDNYQTQGESAPGHYFGDWTVTSAPTCTESGVETRYCRRCEAFETRPVEPIGHDFGDWLETRAPGCVDEGEESRFCSRCEAFETRPVEAKGHSYGAWELVTSETCTTDGEEQRVCGVCGDVETLVRPATGHSFYYGYCRTCWAEDPSVGKITVSPAMARRGDQAELTVSIKNNPGVSSLMLGLNYDENALTLEDVTNGELFGEIADFNPLDGGMGTVSFDSASNVTGDGVLMKLTFTVTDQAWTGWNDVGAFVRFATDGNGDDVDFVWLESSILVVAYGDVNLDGSITGIDASLILQYVANYDDELGESSVDIPLACADVNCDGVVSGMDASLILQYVANFDDETGTSTVVLGPTP